MYRDERDGYDGSRGEMGRREHNEGPPRPPGMGRCMNDEQRGYEENRHGWGGHDDNRYHDNDRYDRGDRGFGNPGQDVRERPAWTGSPPKGTLTFYCSAGKHSDLLHAGYVSRVFYFTSTVYPYGLVQLNGSSPVIRFGSACKNSIWHVAPSLQHCDTTVPKSLPSANSIACHFTARLAGRPKSRCLMSCFCKQQMRVRHRR